MYTNWAHHYSIMKNREYSDALTRRFADCLKKYSTAKKPSAIFVRCCQYIGVSTPDELCDRVQ